MSSRGVGQGAELRPSLPRSRQTTLLQGKPLRPDGYLFKKQLPEDLAQAHLLGTTIQARRTGAMRDYVAPDKYITLCDELTNKTNQKQSSMTSTDAVYAGDKLTITENWPRLEPTGHLRILHANVHGLNHAYSNMECEYFIQQMAQHQVDLPMIVEVNQPLDNGAIRANLTACVKNFDRHARTNYGHSDEPSSAKGWQMGGLMSYLQGGAVHLLKDMGHDECGRWSWIKLGEKNLCVISAYRVGPGTDGTKTIRALEMRRLMRKNHKFAKFPRKAFDQDLTKFIRDQKAKGSAVLLLMDANIAHDSKEIQKFTRNTNLCNVFTTQHPMTEPPRTYDRGKNALIWHWPVRMHLI